MRRYTCAAAAVLLVVFPWRQTPAGDQVAYTLESLATSASIDNLVPAETGINASGDITGTVTDSLGNTRAVRYTDGTGWEYVPGLTSGSTAQGINSHGDIVGTRVLTAGTPPMPVKHAYRYNASTGVIDDIPPLTGGGVNSAGLAINDDGDVVGQSDAGNNVKRGFIARPGQPAVVLPTLSGTTDSACGINNAGQIALTSTSPTDGFQHAARIEADDLTILDAGTVDGTPGMSGACAIDDLGHIGGFSSAGNFASFHAYRWDPGHPVFADAPLPSSFGNVESIAAGVSAGWYSSTVDGNTYAMIYTDANGAVDLNTQIQATSGWVLTTIKGINASGQMVGDGLLNGAPGVFRLTPPNQKDTTPPVIQSVTLTPSSISVVNGQMDPVVVAISATDNSGQPPSCQLSSISGPGVSGVDYAVTGATSGSVKAAGGRTYVFNVTCSDAAGNTSSASATVVVSTDTTAPVISSVTASPSPMWPPDLQMQTVTVSVAATDDSGVASCKLTGVTAPGATAGDTQVTGTLTASVKAVGGRTYTFAVQCTDYSGNASSASVAVFVTPDTTPPTITSFTVSPSTITPPNNAMVAVQATIKATDNVDLSPSCKLTGITSPGVPSSDYAITGPTSAQVRATGNRTYALTATCADFSGNQSTASASVVVPPDTTPPVISSVTATPSSIAPVDGRAVTVTLSVSATDDSGWQTCKLSSIAGPGVGGVDYAVTGTLTGTVKAIGGRTYTFNATCTDAAGNSSTAPTTVTVPPDVTPPVISSLTANPSTIWPPALQMVTVTIAAAATDDSGVVSCKLANIAGPGTPGVDYLVTGQFTGTVRAYAGRTYGFTVQCVDFSGNVSSATTNVVVPPDTTPPVISSVSASPNFLWPPDNKLYPVTVAVAATDFVDPSPSCGLTSITGGEAGDSAITGPLSGVVRAVNGTVYTLTVSCSDFYGNASSASTTVVVTKMNVSGTTPKRTLVVR